VRHIAPFLTSFSVHSHCRYGNPGISKRDACTPEFENDASDNRLSAFMRIMSEGQGANVTFSLDIS